jgi:hypothetical protein
VFEDLPEEAEHLLADHERESSDLDRCEQRRPLRGDEVDVLGAEAIHARRVEERRALAARGEKLPHPSVAKRLTEGLRGHHPVRVDAHVRELRRSHRRHRTQLQSIHPSPSCGPFAGEAGG